MKMKRLLMILGVMSMIIQATELKLNISDIDVKKGGSITVFLFTSEEGYPKVHKEAKFRKTKKASSKNVSFAFDIPKNIKELAIKAHHDMNSDGKVTKNWTGIIPKDGLGFSKGQELSLSGVPKYENAKVSKNYFNEVQKIKIKYYSN